MKIATKTLVSLLIVTVLTIGNSSFTSATSGSGSRSESRIERVTRRHDRKLELRASVLGISTDQLREELKTSDFDQVLKKHGFKTREDFRTAMAGKIKDELKNRGWSDEKIQKVIDSRLARMN
ncbi:MAG: hypothetical protein Q7T74_04485 [Candidatus Saccharibacteria bacterium]|nr:hypothetical protein [Candidatus Saccharibacteria bacterium]